MNGHATGQRNDSWGYRQHKTCGRPTWLVTTSYVSLFLAAIVAANLVVARFGPSSSIVTAFLLIGLDLTTRDALHDLWTKHRALKLFALVASGSLLTVLLNRGAGRIALASTLAFAAAFLVDTLTYHALRDRVRLVRMNGSNVLSSIADSVLFPTVAFGAFLPWTILGQIAAKIGGGFLWSIVIVRRRK